MRQYLELLKEVMETGRRKPTRAVLKSTGRNVDAFQLFGKQLRFNLRDGFPLMTTKFVPFRAVAYELLWFLRGDTNIKFLTDNNVHIWDEWADPRNGELGPVYGSQWRQWDDRDGTIDQVANVIRDIKDTIVNPMASCGRRLIVTAWNPCFIDTMKLPPCHVIYQFDVTEGRLSCHMTMRSADLFLGVPFNIASYALLTHMVAAVVGLDVGELIVSFGDVHIYENHTAQVEEQLKREPYGLPHLHIHPVGNNLVALDHIEWGDMVLIGYAYHPSLKAEVAV